MSRSIFKLTEFQINSTGVDGGHFYVIAEVEYQARSRKLVVYFKDKSDERKLHGLDEMIVEGNLIDDSNQYSLNLLNSILID
ncbi:hypothetical protein C7460_11114 [Marinoscillum furvescens DSM 4134]|uniref:Uncharacterized protein n=1 Tax=Marinoscillum furvescens DSM 4134 TaxID=1122208 RepID=A0A3D9L3L0_MARFU|nr:hypothetical protein C7460_11114 [Marinoscillum furvescens DSM 4134]